MLGLSGPLCRNTSSPLWLLENKFSDQAEQLIQREQKPLAELRRKHCALPANQTIQIVFSFGGGGVVLQMQIRTDICIFEFLSSMLPLSLMQIASCLVLLAGFQSSVIGWCSPNRPITMSVKCFIQLFLFAFLSS